MATIIDFFNYSIENSELIFNALIEHIEITAIAVFFAILIGTPLGITINRYSKADKYVLGVINAIQSVPSLALLGFLIPIMGIGLLPASVMVILYSLLPIVKNTYTGLKNISPETLEVAKGIGLTRIQILYKIEMPLALPVIMSGIRISVVTAVGLVTLAALVGAGGLGYLVFSGLQTVNSFQILAGAIPACLLALFFDFIFGIIELMVTPVALIANKKSIFNLKKGAGLKYVAIGATALLIIGL